jgi:hypothetical protein
MEDIGNCEKLRDFETLRAEFDAGWRTPRASRKYNPRRDLRLM